MRSCARKAGGLQAHIPRLERGFNRHEFEAAFAGLPPDFTWETFPDSPGVDRLEGLDAVIQGFHDLVAEFPDWRVEPQEFIAAGDAILVRNVATATGRTSGTPITQRFTQVWTFRDGRSAGVREFTDHEAALAAAGVR